MRLELEKNNVSQAEIAREYGTSAASVGDWLSGKVQRMPMDFISFFRKKFSVSWDYLMDGKAVVRESSAEYNAPAHLRAIVKELEHADAITLAVVKEALEKRKGFTEAAEAVSIALKIPKEKAYLMLLAKEIDP